MTPEEETLLKARTLGREAYESGKPHTANPFSIRELEAHLTWFNAWMVRRVETEDGCKLRLKDESELEAS